MTTPSDRDLAITETVASEASPPRPAVATVGRYRLERVLGAGGMGIVHAAFDPDLERRVAIKVLRRGGDADARARLLREARAMARLTHANVVSVYEVGTDGDDFIVMELFDGGSLETWLRDEPRSPREITAAFLAAGRGLAAAHAAGLVHRDFKPHNVLRTSSGRIAVTDFGLARVVGPQASDQVGPRASGLGPPPSSDALTATGSIVGTPAYMAPEQWQQGTISPASDQFAFCVALWEALAGTRPFPGTTSEELRAAVELGPSAADASRIPRRLRATLRRGLQPDPAQRWPSMDALLAAIARRALIVPLAIGGALAIATASAVIVLHGGGSTREAIALARADFDQTIEHLDAKTGAGYFFDKWPGAHLAQIYDAQLMKSGLRDGDRLLRVGGRPFGKASLSDLVFTDHVEVELERAGNHVVLALATTAPDVTDPALDAIVMTDPTHAVLPRALVRDLAAHRRWLDDGVHANHLFENGEDRGLWLEVRPYSLYAHVGLMNEDRVIAIDGAKASSQGQLVGAFRALGDKRSLELSIERPVMRDIRRISLSIAVADP